eukprot:1275127-Pyramimonas_sp.AAC.1
MNQRPSEPNTLEPLPAAAPEGEPHIREPPMHAPCACEPPLSEPRASARAHGDAIEAEAPPRGRANAEASAEPEAPANTEAPPAPRTSEPVETQPAADEAADSPGTDLTCRGPRSKDGATAGDSASPTARLPSPE